jgi:D-psicose/D-tagatose/L-ribulose 3-epimerase
LIEIPVVDPFTNDLALTSRLLVENGIQSVVSLALGADHDINTTDAALSNRGERRLEDAVRFARDTGSTYLGGVLYSKMAKYQHPPTQGARENSLAVLRRIADKAKASGITLGLEYVNRYESNLLNTAQQTVQFIQDLGADNVRLHIDTFHVNLEENDQATAVRNAGSLLGYVHAGENHRGYLGTGSIDWVSLFRQLVISDFTGPITFESFSNFVLPEAVATDLALWRNLWSDPQDLARHACRFIRVQLDSARQAVSAIPTA